MVEQVISYGINQKGRHDDDRNQDNASLAIPTAVENIRRMRETMLPDIIIEKEILIENSAIVIDTFKWVTIKGKQVNVGGTGSGGAIEDRQIPAMSGATGAEKTKLLAISDYMNKRAAAKEAQASYSRTMPKTELKATRKKERDLAVTASNAAKSKAVGSGASQSEMLSIESSRGKNAIIERSDGSKHSIWDSPGESSKKPETKKPAPKPEAKKPTPKPEAKKPETKKTSSAKTEPTEKAEYKGKVKTPRTSDSMDATSESHHYKVGQVDVFIDTKHNQGATIKNLEEGLSRVPAKDKDLISSVNCHSGLSLKTYSAGVRNENVAGDADYASGRISFFKGAGSRKASKEIMIHETGHLSARKNSFIPNGFSGALNRDGKKDVSSYGRYKKPAEAFAEAYLKYHVKGKVTSSSGSMMSNTNAFMKERYGEPKEAVNWTLQHNDAFEITIDNKEKKLRWEKWTGEDDIIYTAYDGNRLVQEVFETRKENLEQEITIEKESSIGIVFPNDTDIVIDHAWKTLPSGRQIMIRKGDPGALNGNDMRKINIAVKEAMADPVMMYNIRQDLVKEYIPENRKGSKQQRHLDIGAQDWESSPSGSAATNMAISNNVIKGRKRHAGLSPNQLEEAKRFEQNNDTFPQSDMLKAVNVQVVFNRNMAKEKFGSEPFTVYRGISGDQAKTIKAKAKKGDTIRFDSNTLSSYTTNPEIAKQFIRNIESKKTDGILIKTKVSYKNVFDSYASNEALNGRYKEQEVIVSAKGLKMTGVIM